MSSTKALLKGVNEAIKAQKWDDAIQQAQGILEKEPKNYQALAFLVARYQASPVMKRR